MYLALQRMDGEGLIEDAPAPPDGEDDSRRRYYRITRHGRAEAERESRRLEALVEAARTRKLLAGGGA
jgi:DNA-binding PadR family transcriptional regulator